MRVRFRIDGVLYEVMRPPMHLKNALISRIKIMSRLDIAERRLPQDGRIQLKAKGREMDFRVSVMPTIFGEKVVLRLLNKAGLQLDMTKLGFEETQYKNFREAIYCALRNGARYRTHRERQDHDTLQRAVGTQQGQPKHFDSRRPRLNTISPE